MRTIVLGGPGGRLNAIPAEHWRAIQSGNPRIVKRDERGTYALIVNDSCKHWRPLFTFDASRASVATAYSAVFRRFELV